MKDNQLICARHVIKDGNRVIVSVTIVNLQGQAGSLSHLNVGGKRFFLRLLTFVCGTEVVQPALSDGDDRRIT